MRYNRSSIIPFFYCYVVGCCLATQASALSNSGDPQQNSNPPAKPPVAAPIPTTKHPKGPVDPNNPGGSQMKPNPAGVRNLPGSAMRGPGISASNTVASSRPRTTRDGVAFFTRTDGRVADILDSKRGMDIHAGLEGARRVEIVRGDGSRVVVQNGHNGFVERPLHLSPGFISRAYYYHGHTYVRLYRSYMYRGIRLDVYVPQLYYNSALYGWAYNAWVAPVAFNWNWTGDSWYSYFDYYFRPYPVYPSAATWLTDYLLSQYLQAAYAELQRTNKGDYSPSAAGNPLVVKPEVKQMIADEIRGQLALENQEARQNADHEEVNPASSSIIRLLGDGRSHVFIASENLEGTDPSGKNCVVSNGDVFQLQTARPQNASVVNLLVLASKGASECQTSTTVSIELADLQEMQNDMRATIDRGLWEILRIQGTNGVPAAPPSALAAPVPARGATGVPLPDEHAPIEIEQANQQADIAEKEVDAELKQQRSLPWENMVTNSQTETYALTNNVQITGPPCPIMTAPCNPEYSEPHAFALYQNNLYGTFMFWPNPYFDITSVVPSSATVSAGGTASYIISTLAHAGYAGSSLTFNVSGLPAGATDNTKPGSIAPGNAFGLNITTTASTPKGSYPLKIGATDGTQSYFAYVTLVVD